MLWRAVRFVAGMIAGVALWMWCSDALNRSMAFIAQPLVRVDHRLADSELVPVRRMIIVQPLRDTMPQATIPADQLTYNVILLVALFASNVAAFSARNLKMFALALLIVLLIQPIGLLISIESTYANQQEAWSEAHYGDVASKIWINVEVFYRLIGMFGIVFAAWWATTEKEPSPRGGEKVPRSGG